MGDIVGRLFREFAVTLERDHPGLGGRLADADADDVRQAAAPHARGRSRAGFYRASERFFERDDRALRHDACAGCCGHQPATLLVAVAHAGRDRSSSTSSSRRASSRCRTPASSSASPRRRRRSRSPPWPSASRRWRRSSCRIPAVREPVLVHRHRRHQHDAQQRPHPDQPEAARRARHQRQRRHPPPAAAAGRRSTASRSSCSRCRT